MKPRRTPWVFSKVFAVAPAHRHDRSHVHLVEGGEDGGGVLGLLEALGEHARAGGSSSRAARRVAGVLAPSDPSGAASRGGGRRRFRGLFLAPTGEASPLAAASCASTSSLVMRPIALPVPLICARGPSRRSAAALRAAGLGRGAPSDGATASGSSARPPPRTLRLARFLSSPAFPKRLRSRIGGRSASGRLRLGVDVGEQLPRSPRYRRCRWTISLPAPPLGGPGPRARPCRSRARSGSRSGRPPRPRCFFHSSSVASGIGLRQHRHSSPRPAPGTLPRPGPQALRRRLCTRRIERERSASPARAARRGARSDSRRQGRRSRSRPA